MKAANTSETLLISTRYKEPTEDSTSAVNQRQNLAGLTAGHYMDARRTRGAVICLNIPLSSKQQPATAFLLRVGEKLQLKVAINHLHLSTNLN
jgi:hypothetical protein